MLSRNLCHKPANFLSHVHLMRCMLLTGAGKSTLLDILAQRKSGAGIEGHITVNGTARRRNLKKLSTYVPQVRAIRRTAEAAATVYSITGILRMQLASGDVDWFACRMTHLCRR